MKEFSRSGLAASRRATLTTSGENGRGHRPRLTIARLTTFLFFWTWQPGRPDRPDSAGGRSPSAHRRSARHHWSWSPRRRACHGWRDDGSHCAHPTRRGSSGAEATPRPPFPARLMAAAPMRGLVTPTWPCLSSCRATRGSMGATRDFPSLVRPIFSWRQPMIAFIWSRRTFIRGLPMFDSGKGLAEEGCIRR